MSYKEQIGKLISAGLEKAEVDASALGDISSLVEVPKDRKMGDFAFPCFRLAKQMRKGPPQIAAQLLPLLEECLADFDDLSEVIAAGPYLNFRVNKAALAGRLIPAILDGSFLANREANGEKVMIEYSQPNTHKAFHVGHTRNVALGDALVRIFEWCGHEVVAANYIGDEGTHIAKCLWYFENHFKGEVPDHNLGEFLGDLYTRASNMLDFKQLSKCPMPEVTIAEVTGVKAIEGQEKVKSVTVNTVAGEKVVVCGGIGYKVGDKVAYGHVGSRVNGRRVDIVEKYGVTSEGMLLSLKELGFGDDNDPLYIFPEDAVIGTQVAEFFALEGALEEGQTVLGLMKERTEGVSKTLARLEAKEPELTALWEKTKGWSMDEFYKIYDWLEARFDHYFFESDVGDRGKQICLDFHKKGVLVESEGAIGTDLEAYKMPFLILIKSDGAGLYATKDIALAKDKFEKYGIDRSVYVVDRGQSLHFQQVFKTLELMGFEQAEKCYHLAYGLVVLPEGKMGSRHGNVILFSELREKLVQMVTEKHLEAYRGEWRDEEIAEAARRIAIASIRYGMTNQDNGKNIVFDMDEWTGATGNTGTYMLYAYARTRSILRKAGDVVGEADWSLLTEPAEENLLNQMDQLEKVVARARDEYRPQLVCMYLYSLSKDLSRFYDSCPVLKAGSDELKLARLRLVDAVGRVIQKGLALLGIPTLERL